MEKETKIGIKLEEETKSIKKMCEQLGDSIKHEFDKGIEHIEVEEMKEAIDMLKDLYAMKKDIVEACYYKQIMEAMEESEYGEDYDWEGRMGYRGQSRDSMGRFTSRGGRGGRGSRGGRRGYEQQMMIPEEYEQEDILRDMDMNVGRMYYQGEGQGRSGQGGQSRQGGSQGGGQSQSRGYSENQSGGRGGNQGRGSSRYGYSHDKYMEERQKYSKEDPEDKKKRTELLNEYMEDFMDSAKEMVSDMSPEEKQMWKVKINKLINM